MKNVFDMKSPNGQLYDTVIVTVPRTYYLRDGKIVEVEEHEVYVNDGYKATHCWGYESTDDFS